MDAEIVKAARQPGTPTPAVLAYERQLKEMDARFANSLPKTGDPQGLGKATGVKQTDRGAIIQFEYGAMRIAFLMPDFVQVRVRHDDDFGDLFPSSAAVVGQEWGDVEPKVLDDKTTIVVGAGNYACVIPRDTGQMSIVATDGTVISGNDENGFQWVGDGVRWTRFLSDDEWSYGLAQRPTRMNIRGHEFALKNFDPALYMRGEDPCYYSIPFYFGFQSKYALGIFWDNPAHGRVNIGKTVQNKMTFEAAAGEICFYLTASLMPDMVLDRYTQLTGRPYFPPLWALGYHQSRYSYESAQRVQEIAEELRQRRIPCDAIHFDIGYMDDYRIFSVHPTNFPDMRRLTTQLELKGFKAVAILDPAVKKDEADAAYADGIAKDVFLKYPDDSLYTGVVWPGEAVFPDFSAKEGRTWWAEKVAAFLEETGFDAVWNDMNEPTVFREKMPDTLPGYIRYKAGYTHVEAGNNTYALHMTQATRDGIQKAYSDKRPFTFSRSGYAGVQRYGSSWTGDNLSTWDHLRLSVSMLLNLGLSGIPFSGPDIGGFASAPDGELYTRWIQLGSMLPFFRTHTSNGTPDQEPWSFGSTHTPIVQKYINLRYQFLPYIYSVMAMAHQRGIPVVRPGFFHDRNDPFLRAQDDAFLVGDSIFVAPILEKGATKRTVYLPRGAWYNYWTNRLIDGARQIEVEAPLDTMPIFIRAGHVIPLWPVQQYVGENNLEEIAIRAYAGPGETTL
jgi:alpha-glucosidase